MVRLSLTQLERHLFAASDILRREGMDAATYKDFIFGMLFLKRCSDVWGEGQTFGADRGAQYGEHPGGQAQAAGRDELHSELQAAGQRNSLRVPERARWDFLLKKINDSTDEPYGAVLDNALRALTESNDCLEHVLDHIRFMRVQGNKRIVSDQACRDLVRHFDKHRLRDEDFPFSDVMGAAYEFLISLFAESAGKKAGDFYTPRKVVHLLVRILDPAEGMSVYDPTCGSGGMLMLSREHVEHSGGDPGAIRLCGQVNDASAWSLCKLNMLLRGVPDADIQLEDTLLHPMHRQGGELEQFDRVIANPPFSQNYTRTHMEFPGRFQWGWCATSGKKADLMFAQHMLAVCKADGMIAAVMPLGVLFRGGAEQEIRRRFLEQDLIEAIIGLPHNLFYGAGIPACVLVMRPNPTQEPLNPGKPVARRGHVLFINADAEFEAGRAQNQLLPEHVEKIVATFQAYEDVPAYARVVPVAEITSQFNDCNLNIRRYVDNSPPPERHDVRAHLLGGVPAAELADRRALFDALGLDARRIFVRREPAAPEGSLTGSPVSDRSRTPSPGRQLNAPSITGQRDEASDPTALGYFDFVQTLAERAAIRPLIENDAGVELVFSQARQRSAEWWAAESHRLSDSALRHGLNTVRAGLIETFVASMLEPQNDQPGQALDRFSLAGILASWWTQSLPALRMLRASGFPSVIESWMGEIADAIESDEVPGPVLDPLTHPLVRQVIAHDVDQLVSTRSTRPSGRASSLEVLKELRSRCNAMDDAAKRSIVLLIFGQAIQARVEEALREKRQALVSLIEELWDKYRITLSDLRSERARVEAMLDDILTRLAYR